jgi:anti-sigma factor RsiW
VVGAGLGAAASGQVYDILARNVLGTVDTRSTGNRLLDAGTDFAFNAAGQKAGELLPTMTRKLFGPRAGGPTLPTGSATSRRSARRPRSERPPATSSTRRSHAQSPRCRGRPPMQVLGAARRLERRLIWRRIGLRLRRTAAAVLLVGAGWFAHAQVGLFEITDTKASPKPPAFAEDARHSHQTTLIRARMVSQPEISDYDPAEILAETGIVLPEFPPDWRVVDAQVFPSQLGHSVELALDTDALGRVSIFAARSPSFGMIAPTLARSPMGTTVYWQSGELVYALTGSASEGALERAAARLHANLG